MAAEKSGFITGACIPIDGGRACLGAHFVLEELIAGCRARVKGAAQCVSEAWPGLTERDSEGSAWFVSLRLASEPVHFSQAVRSFLSGW
eukprot:2977785-Rhodomonas_salina.1